MSSDKEIAKPNPYAPPKEARDASLPRRAGWFYVGQQRRLVEVFWSNWSGLEVYTVDGVEVLRTKNYQIRGIREFDVGEHQVVVKLDAVPRWSILLRPWEWVAEAYIDGERAVDDITAELRARMRSVITALRYVILALLVLLGVLIASLVLLSVLIAPVFGTAVMLG